MAAESLNQAAAARHKRTIDRAEQALRQLDAEGAAVSFQSVARRAGVSRQWLYTQPALRREIEVLRDRAPARADSVPARQRASGASLRQRVESLRAENQRLREENQSLKAELAIAYGHQRAAARGSRPSPSRNPKTSEDRLYPSKALIDLPCSSMSERRLVEEWEAQANAWKQWTRTPVTITTSTAITGRPSLS
jgi:Family of unknown function (DUF6262)